MTGIREFIDQNYLHYNARTVGQAARAWEAHLEAGGKMMVTLAGAMSTARLGKTLAPLIRAGKVHAITCTGANLEEDIFNLLAWPDYEQIPEWRGLRAEDDKALYDRGMNRVTDTAIPETVMKALIERLITVWKAAGDAGERKRPSEYVFDALGLDDMESLFRLPREESWVLAAKEMGIPIYTPGWADSTTGNMFVAEVWQGNLAGHHLVHSDTEQFEHLMRWYQAQTEGHTLGVGFFQIGGGIAGDFPICAVPCLIQDLELDVPFWGYFCQISDAVTSYGGYSGAPPNEKITWGKLDVGTPKFMIQSDATIVGPLIFQYLLEA